MNTVRSNTARNTARRGPAQQSGFTLLELIVVITIIGLLGTMVVVKVSTVLGRANETKIKSDLQAIVRAAEQYQAMEGYLPQTLEELERGTTEDGRDTISIEKAQDPWGNEYEYELRDGKPQASCFGRDGQPGGEGDDADYFYPEEDEGF